jgi:hypothetical protein
MGKSAALLCTEAGPEDRRDCFPVASQATGKHQRAKAASALGCAAATAGQSCSYSFLAEPLEDLYHRHTGLPDTTTLSQMHTVPKVMCSRLKPYQQNLLEQTYRIL